MVNRGLTMAEAARLVHLNLRRSIVNLIMRTFRQENRIDKTPWMWPCVNRPAVVEMVKAWDDTRLSKIEQAIEENDDTFANVASISIPTITRFLKRHQVSMKHIYLVPFERNNDWVKQPRAEYVQMVLDAAVNHHKCIFVDEVGFNLACVVGRGSSANGRPFKCLDNVGKHVHVSSYL